MTEKTANKVLCDKCGYENRSGIIFCEQCGNQLIVHLKPTGQSAPFAPTIPSKLLAMDDDELETVDVQNIGNGFHPGTCIFEEHMLLRLEVKGSGEKMLLRLEQDTALMIGRKDTGEGFSPEIDLIPYGAYRSGISRRHATLTLRGKRLFIEDEGSSNGTYINAVLLDAKEAHQLRDNDQLRLGKLTFMVGFQPTI